MTIYDIPGVIKQALPKAATVGNITAGFKAAGIVPFNRDIFKADDFLPAYVSDRPIGSIGTSDGEGLKTAAAADQPELALECCAVEPAENSLAEPELMCSMECYDSAIDDEEKVADNSPTPTTSTFPTPTGKTPDEIRPFGKAGPRKKTNSRKRKSEILTDTPVKAALANRKSHSLARKSIDGNTTGCGRNSVSRKLKTCDNKRPAKETSTNAKDQSVYLVCSVWRTVLSEPAWRKVDTLCRCALCQLGA